MNNQKKMADAATPATTLTGQSGDRLFLQQYTTNCSKGQIQNSRSLTLLGLARQARGLWHSHVLAVLDSSHDQAIQHLCLAQKHHKVYSALAMALVDALLLHGGEQQ